MNHSPLMTRNKTPREEKMHPASPSNQAREAVTERMPGPLKMILVSWMGIFLNYLLGPNDYPWPAFTTIIFVAGAILAFSAGAYFGFQRQFRATRPWSSGFIAVPAWETVIKVGPWISAVGALTSFVINLKAGKSIGMALYNTEVVRAQVVEDLGPISIVANAFGFLSFSWLLVTVLMCRFHGGYAKHRSALFGSCTGVGAVLMIYVVNVNRTAFLVLILLILAYIGIAEKGRWKGAIAHLGQRGLAAAIAICLLSFSYLLFIAVARADKGENEQFVAQNMSIRYHLTALEDWDYDTACGVYKLQWYASHQLRNMDQILQNGEFKWVTFDGRLFLMWPYNQASRFYERWRTEALEATDNLAAIITRAGAYDWQWCTALLTFSYDFGLLGAILLLFLIGALIGGSYRSFRDNGSVLSALICFWWSALAMLFFINYPVDNFFQTNLFLILMIKSYFWMIGKNSV